MSEMPESTKREYDRIGREREAASREADRDYVKELIRVCVEMAVWSAIGLLLGGLAFAVSDEEVGRALLYAGQIINVSGVAWSIGAAYKRGVDRGDW
jgi:hypothetical protein